MTINSFVRTVVFATVAVLFCGTACVKSHRNLSPEPSSPDATFMLIVEGDDGQMLGYRELPGAIADFAITKKRHDGATLIKRITVPSVRSDVGNTIKEILTLRELPLITIEKILKDRHVTCHTALQHPAFRGGGFAGPGMLECSDAIVVGTKRLSRRPVWLQRGLIMENDPKYSERIALRDAPPQKPPVPTTPASASNPTLLTWEQAAPYLSAVVAPNGVTTENGSASDIKICTGIVEFGPELSNPQLVVAAQHTMSRFTNEDLDGNPRLLSQHMKDGHLAVDELDPAIRSHLLELMQEELKDPTQISSATSADE